MYRLSNREGPGSKTLIATTSSPGVFILCDNALKAIIATNTTINAIPIRILPFIYHALVLLISLILFYFILWGSPDSNWGPWLPKPRG